MSVFKGVRVRLGCIHGGHFEMNVRELDFQGVV